MKKLVINKKKLRPLEPTKNPFQSLVRSIIFQQLSGKAASTILKRFTELWPRKKFPKPAAVLAMPNEMLRSVGLSRGKIVYVKDLAAKFLDGTITPRHFPTMSDQEIIEHLTRVKGVGVWTAHMFLMFALNRPNILPTGDLAIRKGFQKAFKLKLLPDEKKMVSLAKPYEGEHTYLSLYLWAVMDDNDGGW